MGARRPVPSVVPARRLRDRALVVQRRRRAVVPGAGPAGGGGRRGLGVRRRRRRAARAARARRHERRPGAGRGGPRRRPLPGDGRRRRRRQPPGRQARPARRDVRRHQRRERPHGRRARPGATPPRSVSSRRRPGPASAARWCARCWGAAPRASARPGTTTPTTRLSTPTARPATAAPYGRFTRNFVVQGTGAEWALCWIADLRNRLWRLGGDRLPGRPAAPRLLPARRGRHPHPRRARRRRGRLAAEAAATAGALLFRDLAVDFPLNTSVVRSYADAGKPGAPPRSPPTPTHPASAEEGRGLVPNRKELHRSPAVSDQSVGVADPIGGGRRPGSPSTASRLTG